MLVGEEPSRTFRMVAHGGGRAATEITHTTRPRQLSLTAATADICICIYSVGRSSALFCSTIGSTRDSSSCALIIRAAMRCGCRSGNSAVRGSGQSHPPRREQNLTPLLTGPAPAVAGPVIVQQKLDTATNSWPAGSAVWRRTAGHRAQ